ncbi:hypothetical protein EI982_14260 [Haloplanus rallus]|jgi:hypothetical protein|uniref:Uncharacterized protein n=1 Tax=Haloplanus rallus TaxID=1816183 RepID=A0A6B9FBQ3_9EURY|nr:hypothetical protein [Haloplanus rallus]QGX95861.1 hypothetical protein EI982_14260 [Haloplanus rallus]
MPDRIMSGGPGERPYGGTCPACKREYRRAITFTGDGVIRGELTGDVCITPEFLFAHSEITVAEPDDDFPTKEVGGMGNRREIPVEPTAVTDVWVSADSAGSEDDGFVFPDADEE